MIFYDSANNFFLIKEKLSHSIKKWISSPSLHALPGHARQNLKFAGVIYQIRFLNDVSLEVIVQLHGGILGMLINRYKVLVRMFLEFLCRTIIDLL